MAGRKGAARKGKARSKRKGTASPALSPLAPKRIRDLPPLAGVRLAVATGGIRHRDRTDVFLATLVEGTQVAGVLTRSKTASAPVEWCRNNLRAGMGRALLVNSGNANAFTGRQGAQATQDIAKAAAAAVDCRAGEVFLASTGVIGEPLPARKITNLLSALASAETNCGWLAAAQAMMTTDTYPKLATDVAQIGGQKVRINGIAKGSGMIAPDMATMLAFIFTDAKLTAPVMKQLLAQGIPASFNSITVDGDTSTSDTVLFFATGQGAGHPAIRSAADPLLDVFREALNKLLLDLALQVVCDGEGASKLIQVDVSGASSDNSARNIAFAIANSPLVKTAIGGGDANWGRIVMAVGKAGEPADRDRLKIWFGSELVAEKGARASAYRESAAAKAVAGRTVRIGVDLGLGSGRARVYTCDLTQGYVRINGSYRS